MAADGAGKIELALLESTAAIAAYAETPLSERIGPRTTREMLEQNAARFGADTALAFQVTPEPTAPLFETTYAALLEEARAFANAAHAAGVAPGGRVALLMPNLPEMVFAIFGAHMIGVAAPINPLLEPDIIGAILRDLDAEILVTLGPTPGLDLTEKAVAAVATAPNVKLVVEANVTAYFGLPPTPGRRRVSHAGSETQAEAVDYRVFTEGARRDELDFERSLGPDDLAALYHSGGTTGAPKLVQHRHGAIMANAVISNAMLSMGERGPDGSGQAVVFNALPLFHVFAGYALLISPMSVGAKIVLATPAGFRTPGLVENIWKLVERHGVHLLAAVPTAVSALEQVPVDADVSTVNMLVSGGSALPGPLALRFAEHAGVRVCEGYGMTETVACMAFNPHVGGEKTGAVGFAAPYVTIRIARFDEEDRWLRDCEIDEIGEVCVNGPHVFPGYLDPKRDQGVFFEAPSGAPGRFFRTGDLGRVDPDGFIWLTGRAKDLIIRGGHNIDPGMIEDALMEHDDVTFAGAVGQPDAYAGEKPCAYVELHPGAAITPEALAEFAAARIQEKAARPVMIEILPEMPKTAVGKVFKPALRDRATLRVCEAALRSAGVESATLALEADPKAGQTLVVSNAPADQAEAIAGVLDALVRSWRLSA